MTIVTSKNTRPQASVIVWNYNDRMALPDGAQNTQEIDETIYLDEHITSIKTNKSKSEAAGVFEINLAPTYNWVNRLTTGSWLAINMSQGTTFGKYAAQETMKMLGRIDSIRVQANIDENGTRSTSYTISGRDWASIFDNSLYVDSLALGAGASEVGNAMSFLEHILDFAGTKSSGGVENYLNTTKLITGIKDFFGVHYDENSKKFNIADLTLFPEQIFHMPEPVQNYFGLTKSSNTSPTKSTRISDLISITSGVLNGQDSYKDIIESVGIPAATSFLGQNNFWQILNEHSNHILNEVVAEMRWPKQFQKGAELTLYKRVKPFLIDTDFLNPLQKKDPVAVNTLMPLVSCFSNIKRAEIPLEDILSVDAGTNWRDKLNFIEIMFEDNIIGQKTWLLTAELRLKSQILDREAASREGFKPLIIKSRWFPPAALNPPEGDSTSVPLYITHWKYLLKEWYFNTHNLLNGAVTFIGQENYIGVGDNVMIPAEALGKSLNFNTGEHSSSSSVFLLAHIESLSNDFVVSEDGARHFITSVNFVRGIFTDADGRPLKQGKFSGGKKQLSAIDAKAKTMVPNDELTVNVNLATLTNRRTD